MPLLPWGEEDEATGEPADVYGRLGARRRVRRPWRSHGHLPTGRLVLLIFGLVSGETNVVLLLPMLFVLGAGVGFVAFAMRDGRTPRNPSVRDAAPLAALPPPGGGGRQVPVLRPPRPGGRPGRPHPPVTRAELADRCGVSANTIDRRLAELVAAGAVDKEPQILAGGQVGNIYRVWLSPPGHPAPHIRGRPVSAPPQ